VTPNGPPDRSEHWEGLLIPRWNFLSEVLEGVIWDTTVDLNVFFSGTSTPAQVADRIEERAFAGAMDPLDKADLVAFASAGMLNAQRRRETLQLALASPGFQWF
jgi:hypothetical protein